MKVIYLRQHRIVICRVLTILVVPHQDHLHFFHIILLEHLISTLVDNIMNCRLVSTPVEPSFVDLLEDFICELVTFLKASMIRTNKNDAQVVRFKANVYVQHKLFRATRKAHRRPSLSVLERGIRHEIVKDYGNVYIEA